MSLNPLVPRRARVTVRLTRPDSQGVQTENLYQFVEHRMRISVRQGGSQFGNVRVEIFGVKLATMNQIARLWLESLTPQNSDTLAIDVWDGHDFIPLFAGVITWSAVNAARMPDVALEIEANDAFALMNSSASPYANAGPVRLRDALATIIAPANFTVEFSETAPDYNETDLRLTGSPMQQVTQLMNHHPDLAWFTNLQRLVVRKANAPLEDSPVRIAADTGLMGYPVYSTSGLQLGTLFNPRLRPGVTLDVETLFDFVNRTVWVAAVLVHQIEPNVPGGQWATTVAANSFGTKGNRQ